MKLILSYIRYYFLYLQHLYHSFYLFQYWQLEKDSYQPLTSEEHIPLHGQHLQLDHLFHQSLFDKVFGEGKVKEAGIKVADAVLSPVHVKDAKQKKAFVGAKKGDVITFNPQKAMENEADLASFLKISKDAVKDVTADFSFEIQQITRYNESPVDQSLFDKVFGEGKVKDEKEFRALIAEGVKESYVSDSDYKFGIDAKEVLVKKLDKVVFPEAFLKLLS